MTVIWNGYHVHLVEEIAVNQEVRYAFTLVCRVFNVCLIPCDKADRGDGYSWYYRAFPTVEEIAIEMNAILNPETSVHLFGALGEVTS